MEILAFDVLAFGFTDVANIFLVALGLGMVIFIHELGHFLFHAPETGATASFHHVAGLTREECEADLFALCAVLPTSSIFGRSPQDLIEEGFSPTLVKARLSIFAKYHL